MNRVTDDSKSFKANICVVFLAENTFRIILYLFWGIITLDVVRQAVVLVPFVLIGLALGMLSGKVLDERIVKRVVIVMLVVSGAALVVNGL